MDNTTTKPKVGATDFFLYLGYIVTFYTFVATYITLLFSLINTLFPDRQNNYFDPYGTSMRLSVSLIIVATPLWFFLLKKIHARLQEMPEQKELWIRRWGLFLTLFLSVAALAIDLVVLINTFLGGEITTRFTLKALIILIIGGVTYWYTKQELDNTFVAKPTLAKRTAWATILIVVASLVTGFSYIGSPMLLRNIRDDNQREQDLSSLRYQVLNYYQSKNAVLPTTLSDITIGNPYDTNLPTDPATEEAYGYKVLPSKPVNGALFPAFELCATFAEDGSVDERIQNAGRTNSGVSPVSVYDKGGYMLESDFSEHPAGEKCFEISIDPERYPPYSKPTTTR